MGKYAPLRGFLGRQSRREPLVLTFFEIEDIVGASLPPSAYRHRSWWANTQHHVQAGAWMSARWQVTVVSLTEQRARFEPF